MRKNIEYQKVAQIYNQLGRSKAVAYLQNELGYKNPSSQISRMKRMISCGYDKETDHFNEIPSAHDTDIFLDINQICAEESNCMKKAVSPKIPTMESLYEELIREKLLEYVKYIQISKVTGEVSINKTALLQDGYKLAIY